MASDAEKVTSSFEELMTILNDDPGFVEEYEKLKMRKCLICGVWHKPKEFTVGNKSVCNYCIASANDNNQ